METLELTKDKKRSAEQKARIVEKTISEIRKVINVSGLVKKYEWFDNNKFNELGLNQVITDTCLKYKISESHIRLVGGWVLPK